MPFDAAAGDDAVVFGGLFFEKYASAPIAAAATTNTAIMPELIQATPKAMSVAIPNTINLFVFIRFTGPYLRYKFCYRDERRFGQLVDYLKLNAIPCGKLRLVTSCLKFKCRQGSEVLQLVRPKRILFLYQVFKVREMQRMKSNNRQLATVKWQGVNAPPVMPKA